MITYAVFKVRCENLGAESRFDLERYRSVIQSAVRTAFADAGEVMECSVYLEDFIEVPRDD